MTQSASAAQRGEPAGGSGAVQDMDLGPLAKALLAVAVHVHGVPTEPTAPRANSPRAARPARAHTATRRTRR
jgi:hypothetical protein